MPTASCSAAWSKAHGRRRRAPIRGSSRRCGTISGSTCRSGASALGARFRASARRAGGDPDARRQARRRADGRVALRAAARGGRGRERWKAARERGARYLGWARELDRARERQAGAAPAPAPAARRAARRSSASPRSSTGCAIPTRSTPSTFSSAPARRRRHAAGRARPRHRDPWRDRRIHRDLRQGTARRSARARCSRSARSISRRCRITPRRAPSGGRASCASRAGSSPGKRSGAPTSRTLHAEVSGELDDPSSTSATFTLTHARRPHRAAAPTAVRDPRLQDRLDADREAGAHRALAAADARSRDPARTAASRTLPPGSRQRARLCVGCAGGDPAGEAKPIDFKEARPTSHADRALARLTSMIATFEDEQTALSLAGQPDVEDALRRLRPSGARREWSAGGEDEEGEAMNEPHRRSRSTSSDRGVRSGGLRLGRRQCRLGQDPRAGAARDPPAARRHRRRRKSSASPSPRPPPPTWRTACSTRSAKWTPLDDAALDAEIATDRRPPARCDAARAGAPAVRAGARDAGRAEGADHPRVLHAAAAPVSVRGGRGGALRGAERSAAQSELIDRLRMAVLLRGGRAARRRRSAARWRPRSRRRRIRPSTRWSRGDRAARRIDGVDRARGRHRGRDRRPLRTRSASTPDETVETIDAGDSSTGSLSADVGMARRDRGAASRARRATRSTPRGFDSLRLLDGSERLEAYRRSSARRSGSRARASSRKAIREQASRRCSSA